jgi:hypothetical protein
MHSRHIAFGVELGMAIATGLWIFEKPAAFVTRSVSEGPIEISLAYASGYE